MKLYFLFATSLLPFFPCKTCFEQSWCSKHRWYKIKWNMVSAFVCDADESIYNWLILWWRSCRMLGGHPCVSSSHNIYLYIQFSDFPLGSNQSPIQDHTFWVYFVSFNPEPRPAVPPLLPSLNCSVGLLKRLGQFVLQNVPWFRFAWLFSLWYCLHDPFISSVSCKPEFP